MFPGTFLTDKVRFLGSRRWNGTFQESLTGFRGTFHCLEPWENSLMDPGVSHHVRTNCIVVVWYIFGDMEATRGCKVPKTRVSGAFLMVSVTLRLNNSSLKCGRKKVGPVVVEIFP